MRTMRALPTVVLTALIRGYRLFVSPLIGPTCRFYPSCSAYGLEAVTRFGAIKGSWLIVKRLGRCHPWHPGGYDPVPEHHHQTCTHCGPDSLKSLSHG